jgi:hypothetical protein
MASKWDRFRAKVLEYGIYAFLIMMLAGVIAVVYSLLPGVRLIYLETTSLSEVGVAFIIAASLGVSSELYHKSKLSHELEKIPQALSEIPTELEKIRQATVEKILEQAYPHLKELWKIFDQTLFTPVVVENENLDFHLHLDQAKEFCEVKNSGTVIYKNVGRSTLPTFKVHRSARTFAEKSKDVSIDKVSIEVVDDKNDRISEFIFDNLNQKYSIDGKEQTTFPSQCFQRTEEKHGDVTIDFDFSVPDIRPDYKVRFFFIRKWLLRPGIDDLRIHTDYIVKELTVRAISEDKQSTFTIDVQNSYNRVDDKQSYVVDKSLDEFHREWEITKPFMPYQGFTIFYHKADGDSEQGEVSLQESVRK